MILGTKNPLQNHEKSARNKKTKLIFGWNFQLDQAANQALKIQKLISGKILTPRVARFQFNQAFLK